MANTLISMLRAVNVAGQNRLKMSQLVEIYQSLGFVEVRTFLQSGNVVFAHTGLDVSAVAARIEKALKNRLGLDVTVIVRTPDELRQTVARNPFTGNDRTRIYLTFLNVRPKSVPTDKFNATRDKDEDFLVSDREGFLYMPNGYGRTKLSNSFVEKVLGVRATTRNWNTVNALLDMANQTS